MHIIAQPNERDEINVLLNNLLGSLLSMILKDMYASTVFSVKGETGVRPLNYVFMKSRNT